MYTTSIVYISSFVKGWKVIAFTLLPYFFVTCSRYNVQKVVFFVILGFHGRVCVWANSTSLMSFEARALTSFCVENKKLMMPCVVF